ncbi:MULTISPECIES: hypothetical protein [unclassified Polaromonas]|uniref:hypothetical protein n=1 Tax=unclassified Polaromonas TaxID=2638319 RepID=UPI000F08E13A|nr:MULTISPECIES: hypothetical protein [unclassified Polaromonas]AYQ26900.1 hypothetical protein DT070_01930 [Polaromonas sp. SP1]QGJ18253.1 hypothetical protein F7R28_07500 [Polaromonas sp. Pch-P]
MTEQADTGSSLMKMVEAIAISPQDARVVVEQYETQARKALPRASNRNIQKIVTDKIIQRYSRLAATSGAVSAIPGVVPGVGTAAAVLGGGLADVTVCMKLQIDMTMCLAVAINKELSNEDAKHMSFLIALAGSLEKLGTAGMTKVASKAGVKMVKKYLTGPTLATIKELFKKIGIVFTQNAAAKAIPFGVGVLIGGSANYALTRYVGKTACELFLLDIAENCEAVD